jgi:two-component system NtrC family sensor kinase
MRLPLPESLKVTVPLILLAFAATLSTVNLIYHVPRAERAAEDDSRKRLAQELSRLQSTLEYLLLKGDDAIANHQVSVLAHNHDVVLAALTDDKGVVVSATRRAWIGQPIADLLPQFDLPRAAAALSARRGEVAIDGTGNILLGYAGVQLGSASDELRSSRTGGLFLAYDLQRYKSEARAQVIRQSLYWAGWVTALALAMWLVFHLVLTRRTARLVHAAEQLAAGDLSARSGLRGRDELGRLSRAFDAMALEVAATQTRLKQDIAERMRAAEALRVSEASYRAIFDAAEDAIFVNDFTTGAIVDVNAKACADYGYTREEFKGMTMGGLSSGELPYTQENALLLFARARAGEEVRAEWRCRCKDGVLRWHEVTMRRVTIGGQDRILVLARDITEKKRAAEELTRQRESSYQREKLAALGSLLAGVAHELNNPLSVVVARAVMLEEQGDPAIQSAAIKIRTAAERCARIVRTFLAMARQQQPQRGPVAVNDLVAAALDLAGYAIRTSAVDVVAELPPDVPLINADGDQLHQVLLNLIINAQQSLQDHPPPRRIRVQTRYDAAAGLVRIAVADNGPGIPPPLRARIFEPYFTTKPTGVGVGVGLAVSAGIIEAHGGSLTVECPVEGGAVFTVALPVGVVEMPGGDAETSASVAAGQSSILIVDDEAEIREMLAEILTSARHRVVTAASGREALERLAAERYDVILTDMRMPDIDGRALFKEIERRWPRLVARVVFVTGDTLASASRDFVSESGRPVIEKPFLPSEVRRIVAELTADA